MTWIDFRNKLRKILHLPPVFLCDSCAYDHDHVCRRPERPNAVKCPDYKQR